MRILLLASHSWSLVNFRGTLIQALAQRDHEVLTIGPRTDSDTLLQLRALGATHIEVPLERTGLNPLSDLRYMARLASAMRQLSPNIVLAYTIKPVIYGSFAAKLAAISNMNSIITGLGSAFAAQGRGLRPIVASTVARLLLRRALKSNRVVFSQNPDDQETLISRGFVRPDQSFLAAGSGVDLGKFALSPVPSGPMVFILIARLIKEKGIREYVGAARMLRQRFPDARFQILGPTEPSSSSIPRAELLDWQAEGIIEYLGETRDVRPYVCSAHVFVLPSYYGEGIPRTILEALATGRPVITTDMPGCRETVRHGVNGYLVAPQDVESLATAMSRFLLDRESVHIMGKRSRQLAADRFDARQVSATMIHALGL